ncbi:MAG TPA: Isoquinoline 1-oxidoreductase subunit, partial [Burkholderiaceae bacterium]|nr:Isoquinoline 1-oxidoreductase subunit [Burkholderiaceae bacterium]
MRPTTLVGFALTALLALPAARAQTAALKSPADFAGIADPAERSRALFAEAGKVIQSPRCQNCHPVGQRPSQGDDMHPHLPLVVRGKDDHGAIAMRCATCHQAANFQPAGVPGAPKWHVAPTEMAWQGKSLSQICEQIKDPARNG